MLFGLFGKKEQKVGKKSVLKKADEFLEKKKLSETLVSGTAKPKEVARTSEIGKPARKEQLESSAKFESKKAGINTRSVYAGGYFWGNLIKVLLFLFISVGVLGGNYFLENKYFLSEQIQSNTFSSFDYENENIIPSRGVIRFADRSNYGFSNSVNIVYNEGNNYVFDLGTAKLWGNFEISDANVNFVAGRVVLIPDHATFALEFDGGRVKLSVYNGDVYMGFLENGVSVDEYTDPYSSVFVNKLLVPRDTQVEIPLKKITSKLQSLLYLKLVKEFKYSAIPSSKRGSVWVTENLDKDAKFLELVRQEEISEIIFKGLSKGKSFMDSFVYWSEENFTFVPQKKREILFDHLFAYLDDAVYYANEGDKISSATAFDEFNAGMQTLSVDVLASDDFLKRYDSYIDELSVFGVDSDFYPLLVKLLEKKLLSGRDTFNVMGKIWHHVYEGLDVGSVEAEKALNQYYNYLDTVVLTGEKPNMLFYKTYITFQNQLFDNLFLRYSIFYRDGYFAMKNVLEREYLKLFDYDEELAQEIISNKIDFLKRLMKFFFDEKIDVSEAKQILSRLVGEIDELMPVDDNGVAVIKLFETRLEDIGNFWGYLNSPEYYTSKTYGLTHKERYKTYLEEKDKIWNFINIQEEVLGEVVQEVTVDDVISEVKDVFLKNANLSNIEINDLKSPDDRYVHVSGVIGGYPFTAIYDRDKDLLNEIYAYNELVSDRPVKIDNLLPLFQERFANLSQSDLSNNDELTVESVAQRAARLYIAELVGGYGFDVEMEDVTIVDEDNAIYRVESISKADVSNIEVTFDFMMNGEKVKNLYLEVDGAPVVMDGEYTLDELSTIASAEKDFNVDTGASQVNAGGVLR